MDRGVDGVGGGGAMVAGPAGSARGGGAPRRAARVGAVVRHPLFFVALFVALYGWRWEDYDDFVLMTRDPFVTHPDMMRQFLHSSPLSIFLGWPITAAVGARASYLVVCASGFAVLLAGAGAYLRGFAAERRPAMVAVAFATPVVLVLCQWLGKGDPFLIGFFLAGLASRGRPWPGAAAAALLVASHRELGAVMLAGDALLRRELRWPAVLGAAAAVAAVALYHAELSVPPFSRTDLAVRFLQQGLAGWERVPVAHLMLGFAWFWMVLFLRGRTDDGPRVALAVALCFAVSLDGADYTRDFILCAFPVVVYTAEQVGRDPRLAALMTAWPIPFPFLIQMQIDGFSEIRESQWLGSVLGRLAGLLHLGP